MSGRPCWKGGQAYEANSRRREARTEGRIPLLTDGDEIEPVLSGTRGSVIEHQRVCFYTSYGKEKDRLDESCIPTFLHPSSVFVHFRIGMHFPLIIISALC